MTNKGHRIDASAFWDGCELDLTASKRGLLELTSILRSHEYGLYELMHEPRIGASCVSSIDIESREGRLVLTVIGEVARLSGDQEALSLLAKNLENLRLLWSKEDMQHFHFDPSSDSLLMSPESEAFMIGPQKCRRLG